MFYEQDWLMKQIQLLVRFVAKAVFKKDTDDFSELIEKNTLEADILYKELFYILSQGDICRAENYLYNNIDTGNKQHLALAVAFYAKLNSYSDDFLEKANFSREEIGDGLRSVTELFGLDFAESFLNL